MRRMRLLPPSSLFRLPLLLDSSNASRNRVEPPALRPRSLKCSSFFKARPALKLKVRMQNRDFFTSTSHSQFRACLLFLTNS